MKPELINILDELVKTGDKNYWHRFIAQCIARGEAEEPSEFELLNYFAEKDPAKLSNYASEIRQAQQRYPGLFKVKLRPTITINSEAKQDDEKKEHTEIIISLDAEEDEEEDELLDDEENWDNTNGKKAPAASGFKSADEINFEIDIEHLRRIGPSPDLENALLRSMASLRVDGETPAPAQTKIPMRNSVFANIVKPAAVTGKRRAEEDNNETKIETNKTLKIPAEEEDQTQENSYPRPT